MKRILLSAAVALGLTACNSNVLSLWLVAGKSTGPDSCTVNGGSVPPPTNTETAQNTFRSLGTWQIIKSEDAAGNDVYYLDGPQISGPQGASNFGVLQGTFEDDVYTFDAVIERTEKDALENPQRTTVRKVQATVKLTVNGDSFEGTLVRRTTNTCTGPDCQSNFSEANPDCTSTTELRGTRVEAENLHPI